MGYEWHDFIGNIGVVLVLGTYLMLQLGRMNAQTVAYSALNGLGAIFILVSLLVDFNISSFIIEIAWLLISAMGLFMHLRSRNKQPI
jgi:multisubunit Na+/H+ antiporter MnhB subunit